MCPDYDSIFPYLNQLIKIITSNTLYIYITHLKLRTIISSKFTSTKGVTLVIIIQLKLSHLINKPH